MKKIKWGILGCAGIAEKAVIPAIITAENSNLYGVASRKIKKAREFAKRFGSEKIYGDYDNLINDRAIDAVYIPLPNALHHEWAMKAINAGKHVLCEKPLALNEEEAIEMFQKAEEKNVLLMEAFMYRFHPQTQKVKELIGRGVIGRVKSISASFAFFSERPDDDIRFQEELGGGALYDVGCYTVNALRYLSSREPDRVANIIVERPGSGIDNQGTAILYFSDGSLGQAYYGFNTYDRRELIISGEKGRIYAPEFFKWADEGNTNNIYLENKSGRRELKIESFDHYRLQIEEFSSAILNKGKAPLLPDDTIKNLRVIDALFRSAKNGKIERVGQV